MPVVVDTDVISFLYKRDTRAKLYEPHLNDPPFIVSFIVPRRTSSLDFGTQLERATETRAGRISHKILDPAF